MTHKLPGHLGRNNHKKQDMLSSLPPQVHRLLFFVLLPLCICSALYGFRLTPYGLCIDFVSAHVPSIAMERFIERMVQEALAEDYQWIMSVSDPEALQDLQALQPKLTDRYEITFRDDLAGTYEYKLRFHNGVRLYLGFLAHYWPECPDYHVTDEEITERIRLTFLMEETE
jgi:hypothetical protein